ncbi:MAG: hypothetical protein LBE59_05945 [Nevskiaceae bacterium]|jgi:hypothetical protein|nr:hypothetical protein [Nevskiaceae bacterium]
MQILAWIEQTALSVFVRQDDYAYFWLLIAHALGMALLVGGGIAISLRGLGVASSARLERFAGFIPYMWLGAALAIVSGLGLLIGYPAKALTNPIFALKFICLIGAALLIQRIVRGQRPPKQMRMMAGASLALWLAGVACGKLLLHTYTILMITE